MEILNPTPAPARLALVGDRSATVRAHSRIPEVLDGLRRHEGLDLDAYWLPTEAIAGEDALAGFDGVWLVPGSPYRSEAGAVTAVRAARTRRIPFLGTCGGFQHAVLEYARDVCGLDRAGHAETDPDAAEPVIAALACSLAGHEATVRLTPGSLAERAIGREQTIERYNCAYGAHPRYLDLLTRRGLRFTGHDQNGEPRILELAGHPFFLATLFQPELATDQPRPHPVLRAFAAAVRLHAVNAAAPAR